MAQRRGFSPTRPRSKRATSWGLGPGGSGTTAITATGQQLVGSGIVLAAEEKATIVRTRGNFEVIVTALAGAGEGFHGALGIAVVQAQAFTVGASALPGPLTEAFWDGWLYHRYIDIHSSTGTVGNQAWGSFLREEVDSKAMRKFSANEVVVCMLEVVEIGGVTAEIFFDSRMLLKLS